MKLYRILLCSVLALTVIATWLLVLTGLKFQKTSPIHDIYTLKAYQNTVALFKNEKIIETYPDVVLNTLPILDQKQLNDGITIKSPEDVHSVLEDYDG